MRSSPRLDWRDFVYEGASCALSICLFRTQTARPSGGRSRCASLAAPARGGGLLWMAGRSDSPWYPSTRWFRQQRSDTEASAGSVYQRATNVEPRARSEKGQSGKRRVGLQN